MEQTTDNLQTALAAGAASVQPVTTHGGIAFVAVPEGYKIHDLESLLPVPTASAPRSPSPTPTASSTTRKSTASPRPPPSSPTSTPRPAASI